MILTRYNRLMGQRTPRFYRIAYVNYARNYEVCYPIGLHLVVRVCRRIWEWSHSYNESRFELVVSAAVNEALRIEREKHSRDIENLTARLTSRMACVIPPLTPGKDVLSLTCIVGTEPTIYIAGVEHKLPVVKLGPQWLNLGGVETCIVGITQEQYEESIGQIATEG